jgi:hypothetical protein
MSQIILTEESNQVKISKKKVKAANSANSYWIIPDESPRRGEHFDQK